MINNDWQILPETDNGELFRFLDNYIWKLWISENS